MYSDVFCKVYNELGWNYYPEVFGQQLLQWLRRNGVTAETSLDLACGTGILCRILRKNGIRASGMDLSPGMIEIARKESPEIHYDVADMTAYRPEERYDLVTCTGDALNHIASLSDVEKIFQNVFACLNPGGYFVFDLLNEREVSDSEPFEMDYSDTVRVWFRMSRPGAGQVNLKIRVYGKDGLSFEEDIRETVHDPAAVCGLLRKCGFVDVKCADRLLEDSNPGTTWFVTGKKGDKQAV